MHSAPAFVALLLLCGALGADYATLNVVRTSDAALTSSYFNAYALSVDEQKSVQRMRLSTRTGDVLLYGIVCDADADDAVAAAGGVLQRTAAKRARREFTFNDESLLDASRSAELLLDVNYSLCASAYTDGSALRAAGTLGMRARTSPVWRVWTYASFTASAVRFGRSHPEHARVRHTDAAANIQCARSADEQLCEFDAHVHGDARNVTYTVDFHLDDAHIYVPHALFEAYTSSAWALAHGARRVRLIEHWPPLTLRVVPHNHGTHASQQLALDARLFVPRAFEEAFQAPAADASDGEWRHYFGRMIADAGVLVGDESERRISLGTRVYERLAVHKDALTGQIHAHHATRIDHFGLAECLVLCITFVAYISHKMLTMDPIATMTLGEWPRCALCTAPYIVACRRHRGVQVSVAVHIVVQLLVFATAWFVVAYDARLNDGATPELRAWAYVWLALCSAAYAFALAAQVFVRRAWGVQRVRHLYMVEATAFESAALLTLFALTSVVRDGGADFNGFALWFFASLVVYDTWRRVLVSIDTYTMHYETRAELRTVNFFYTAYVVLVVFAFNAVYSATVLVRYVIYPAFEYSTSLLLVSLLLIALAAFAVTSAYMDMAMYDSLKRRRTTKK